MCNSRSSACSTYTCDHVLTSLYTRAKDMQCHDILKAITTMSNRCVSYDTYFTYLRRPTICLSLSNVCAHACVRAYVCVCVCTTHSLWHWFPSNSLRWSTKLYKKKLLLYPIFFPPAESFIICFVYRYRKKILSHVCTNTFLFMLFSFQTNS